ncbi:MAG: PdaC/SigV domain-containing protein [Lacinutrix venerupis]
MFNSYYLKLIKFFSVIIIITFVFSCKEDTVVVFDEISIIDEDEVIIEINIPVAKGQTEAAKQINTTLNYFVNNALNIDSVSETKESTEESISNFKKSYKDFKTQIGKTLYTNLPTWEVLIDGEVIYTNETLASIAMNSSINTGGAHGNLIFRFFNFDVKTGLKLETKDLINDIPSFTAIAQKYYNKELLSANNNRIEAFKNDTFKLPENLGFSEDGVIVFYDTYNSAVNNVIEFTIPYTVVNDYLNF